MIKTHKSYIYAKDVIEGNVIAPKYVKKTCKEFISICEGESKKYVIDEETLERISNLTKLMNMATGLLAGQTVHDCLVGFQWLFIVAILCVKHRDNISKRRYEMATLLIARKAGKTFLIGVIFTLLLLIEPQFSEFYSVAADGELSRLIKKEVERLLLSSPSLEEHFTVKRDDITCNVTDNVYKPLNYSNNRLDGRMSKVWLADEIGALPNRYAIDAMKSSQMNMENRLGILISTAYPELINPMTEEIEYAKKVLDGEVDNEAYFSLIYAPNEPDGDWQTNDNMIFESNPLALDLKENLDYLYEQRKTAIEIPSARTNFLTKHLNIFIQESYENKFVDYEAWKKCEVDKIDLEGKEVAVGVDASLTTDLTAVTIMYKENGNYYLKSIGFLPEMTLPHRREKIDYRSYEEQGYCMITKGHIVDYVILDEYIRNIESEYNCTVKKLVSDPYNMIQTLQGIARDFPRIEVIVRKQTYTELSPPNKSFMQDVYNQKIFYEKNELLDWNMSNCTTVKGRVTDDILLAKENKNKQRIDLVMATIFAYSELYLEKDIGNIFYSPDI